MIEKIEFWYSAFEKWRRRPLAKLLMLAGGALLAIATPLASMVFNALGGQALLCSYSAGFCGEVELSNERAWISAFDRNGLCEARFKSYSWNQPGSKDFGLGPPGGGTPELECGTVDLSDEPALKPYFTVEPDTIRRGVGRFVLVSFSARYFEIGQDLTMPGRVICGVREAGRSIYRVIDCGVGSVSDITTNSDPLSLRPRFQFASSFKSKMAKASPIVADKFLLGIEGSAVSSGWPRGDYEVALELGGQGSSVRRLRTVANFRLD